MPGIARDASCSQGIVPKSHFEAEARVNIAVIAANNDLKAAGTEMMMVRR